MAKANSKIIQFPSEYAKTANVRLKLHLRSEEDIYSRLVDNIKQKGMKVKYGNFEGNADGTVIPDMQYVIRNAATTGERLEVLLLLMAKERLSYAEKPRVQHVTTNPKSWSLENKVVEYVLTILREIELMGVEDLDVKVH